MSLPSNTFGEERILILAPIGADAVNMSAVLAKANLQSRICPGFSEFLRILENEGAGAILFTEEALDSEELPHLLDHLGNQASWSDLPIVILSTPVDSGNVHPRISELFSRSGNITLLERPLGQSTFISAMQVAIRARKRQYELRDLIEQRESILSSIKDSFVTLDEQWCFTYVNPEGVRLSRVSREALIGQCIWDLYPDLVGSKLYQELHRAKQESIVVNFEFFYEPLVSWFEFRVYPFRFGLTVYSSDITNRKKQEEARLKAEVQLRQMVESIRDYAIISLDPDGKLLSWNYGAQSLFGYTEEEALGQNIEIIFTPEDRRSGRPAKELDEASMQGSAEDERWHMRKEGSLFFASGVVTSIRNSQGALIGFTKVARDITERKENEKKIKELNETLESRVRERTAQLQQTVSDLESFTYSISHDLRAPVRAMKGFAEIIRDDCDFKNNREGCEYLERIIDAGNRMEALIKGLLAYSRTGRGQLVFEKTDTQQLVDQVLQANQQLIASKNARIEVHKPLLKVVSHPLSLSLAVENLLMNAIKFVNPETTPEINLWTQQAGSNIRLIIQDNGIGIAPEYQQKIFGVFERLHTEGIYEGTGIGLAIVKKAVERMGGRVGVDSTLGKGSRFWIELPRG